MRYDKKERRRWKQFKTQHRRLFLDTGLPLANCESRELFDHFLMHGYLGCQEDFTSASVDELSPRQLGALKVLVVAYLRQGFDDPGLSLFSTAEDDRLRKEAGLES